MNEKKTTKATQEIKADSFNQMQSIIDGLQHEIGYNDYHDLDTLCDSDFSNLNDPKVSGSNIAQAINDNPDIIPATNLNVIMTDDETVVMYADETYPYDGALTVSDVLSIMKKLVKLGRHGIYVRIKKNNARQEAVNKLTAKMDL